MTDNMENEQIEINPVENDDVLLPVGWDGVGDIFDASSWTDPDGGHRGACRGGAFSRN